MEFFDLYDRNRQRIGKTLVRGASAPEGTYRLAVHVCLFDRNKQMLIQHRQPFKRKWSGLWDLSAAGSAVSGEDSHVAAERETMEELGVCIDLSNIQPALTVHWSKGFDDVYILTLQRHPSLRLQAEEVMEAKWASREEILQMIDSGSFIPYEPSFIDLLFRLKDHRDIHTREDQSMGKGSV